MRDIFSSFFGNMEGENLKFKRNLESIELTSKNRTVEILLHLNNKNYRSKNVQEFSSDVGRGMVGGVINQVTHKLKIVDNFTLCH